LFGVLVLGFGAITEIRGAFQATRKTDLGVYLRAAWAARSGRDPFDVTDNNGWHYCYPPTFALLLTPIADPMPGHPRDGYPPYWLSVALWYVFGIACVAWSAHVLASAVVPDAARGSRRWWYARTVPVYVCIGGIGHTLGRGQVNVLAVALVAASFAAMVANRRVRSGLWLAAAIVLKVIPGFLLLFPLVRRDRRALVGTAAGLVVLLGLVPAAWWGLDGAIDANRKVIELVLKPGTTGEGDQTRAKELTGTTSTDSQSFQALIHAVQYPDLTTRPPEASRETRLAHWALGGLLTLLTAWVGWRRLGDAAGDQLVFLGCLSALMLLVSPVSHMHYYAFAFPLAAGLWLRSLALRPGAISADMRTTAALVAWGVATALPLFPGGLFDRLREGGFGVVATLGLWALGLWALGLRTVTRSPAVSLPVAGPAYQSPGSRAA
ncbi:MAG TPA: glycosyltransferase family 87 protein, partial [Gemmataceae bacterium]|nr:glycosyltransferase family 87 protein [Gemmataceae bacterium]